MTWGDFWNYGWPWFMGWWGFMPVFGILFMVLMIFFCIRRFSLWGIIHNKQESAVDILKRRYAKGEISKEDFDMMKKDII